MRRLAVLCLALSLETALGAVPRAQEDSGFVELDLRVTSAQHGTALVDRGTSDGLREGDRVLFFPREGGTFEGTVERVEERSAEVVLHDPAFLPASGTRGRVQVPRSRLSPPPGAPAQSEPPAPVPGERPPVEHPPWTQRQDEWTAGEPLLAKVRPLRPEQRPPRMSGRIYTIDDYIRSTEDDRRNGFYRLGGEVLYENAFGHGERVNLAGEINHRETDVPDDDDQRKTRLRVDRLSTEWGGTRFEEQRWEVGRFLQSGLPEFGFLDGAEWGLRLPDGDRTGLSVGFMPEPDQDFDTGDDLQIAGYYRWVRDASERVSAAGGYQKTFHHGDADRDLFVGELLVLPLTGWMFHGTAWVDLYTSGDDAKGPGLGLTQVYANAGRRWSSGQGVHLVYTHVTFPDIERHEFRPLLEDDVRANHTERLALDVRTPTSARSLVRTEVGGWIDEDEEGGDALLGLELEDLFADRTRLDLASFVTVGDFTSTVGGRAGLALPAESGLWRLEYEFAAHRMHGFDDQNDDLPQHRGRVARELFGARWGFTGYAEVGLWDDENSVAVGLYLERRF